MSANANCRTYLIFSRQRSPQNSGSPARAAKPVAIPEARQQVVEDAVQSGDARIAEVDTFVAVVMVRHGGRILPKYAANVSSARAVSSRGEVCEVAM